MEEKEFSTGSLACVCVCFKRAVGCGESDRQNKEDGENYLRRESQPEGTSRWKEAAGLKIGRTRGHNVSPGGWKPSLLCMSKIPTVGSIGRRSNDPGRKR